MESFCGETFGRPFFVGGAASADSFRHCAAEVEVAVHSVGVYRNEEIRIRPWPWRLRQDFWVDSGSPCPAQIVNTWSILRIQISTA